jgi:signal transduction histidine kinase
LKKKITISLYWKCQLIGWSVASLYWGYIGFSGDGFKLYLGFVLFISDVVLYILLTHLYRNIALLNHWQNLDLNALLKRLIPATLVMGIVYTIVTAIKVYFFRVWFNPRFTLPFELFFQQNWSVLLVAGIRLMSIWLLAYHLYHYAQKEINITKENARLELITRDAQLNNLSAQLNPHFLFNSLNNVKALIIDNPKSARRAIDLLSDLLRTSLYSKVNQMIALKDELALVNDYLELEKLRFEERLQFHIEEDNAPDNVLVPRLCLQTLVENAIKHGIAQQKNGGLISIKIKKQNNFTCITVQNPGEIIANEQHNGLGLKNLVERLQLHFKDNAKFEIINTNERTVLSTLMIPAV